MRVSLQEVGKYKMLNLYFENSHSADSEDGLIWKPILRTGDWKFRPGPNGTPIKKRLSVVKGNATDLEHEIGIQDLVDAFEDGAVQHVTVPKSHADKVDENTGYIKSLKVDEDPDRPGQYVLKAGHEFTDPVIKEKVLQGSIANNSCGIASGYAHKETGKTYNYVLKHSALTNHPWINGMQSFDEDGEEEDQLFFAEENPTTTEIKVTVDTTKFEEGLSAISEKVDEFEKQLTKIGESSYNSNNESQPLGFSETNVNGGFNSMPKNLKDLGLSEEAESAVAAFLAEREVEVASAAKAEVEVEYKTKLSEKDSEISDISTKLSEYRQSDRERDIDAYIDGLKEIGFDQTPGFLKEVRSVLLADSGENMISLSEDGETVGLSATKVIERLVDALPKKDDGKVHLSEQAEFVPTAEKPAVDTSKENKKSLADRVKAAEEWLTNGSVSHA